MIYGIVIGCVNKTHRPKTAGVARRKEKTPAEADQKIIMIFCRVSQSSCEALFFLLQKIGSPDGGSMKPHESGAGSSDPRSGEDLEEGG